MKIKKGKKKATAWLQMPEDQKRRIYRAFREQLTEKHKKALNRLLKLPEEEKRFVYDTIRKHLTMKDIRDIVKPPESK